MPITNFMKDQMGFRLGSNLPTPVAMAIGAGSATASANDIKLVSEFDRNVFTTTSTAVSRELLMQSDWDALEISGCNLSEIGIFTSATANVGSCWSREAFTSYQFDGSQELRIECTYKVF